MKKSKPEGLDEINATLSKLRSDTGRIQDLEIEIAEMKRKEARLAEVSL